MSKKLIRAIAILAAFPFFVFFVFVVGEKMASAKFPLTGEGQNYVQTCQGRLVALTRQRDDFFSHLRFMHYPSSLRICSCVVSKIEASQPDDLDLSSMIFIALTQSETDTSEDMEVRVRAIGDEFSISEAKLVELINIINDGYKVCKQSSYRWTAESL